MSSSADIANKILTVPEYCTGHDISLPSSTVAFVPANQAVKFIHTRCKMRDTGSLRRKLSAKSQACPKLTANAISWNSPWYSKIKAQMWRGHNKNSMPVLEQLGAHVLRHTSNYITWKCMSLNKTRWLIVEKSRSPSWVCRVTWVACFITRVCF